MIYEYWLNQIKGIGMQKRKVLYSCCKNAKEVYELGDRQLEELPFLSKKDKEAIKKSKLCWNLEEEYKKLGQAGIRFLTKESGEYPEKLKMIADAPDALYVKGKLPKQNVLSVAVVGARCCSEYGKAVAEEIAETLSAQGVYIVSGMARGIDSWGHIGALRQGRPTFAVLGCGVDVCYPPENQELYQRILAVGGVISEYPPKTEPLGRLFPARNRIISGLSDIVIVIEAREKSGSLITADFALEQGKDVYALPGRITDGLSGGCNRLIKQGAGIILSAEDLLKDLEIEAQKKGKVQKNKKNPLEKQQMVVYSGLDLQPKSMDEIILRTGLSFSEVSGILMELQQKGYIREIFKNYYIRSR